MTCHRLPLNIPIAATTTDQLSQKNQISQYFPCTHCSSTYTKSDHNNHIGKKFVLKLADTTVAESIQCSTILEEFKEINWRIYPKKNQGKSDEAERCFKIVQNACEEAINYTEMVMETGGMEKNEMGSTTIPKSQTVSHNFENREIFEGKVPTQLLQ